MLLEQNPKLCKIDLRNSRLVVPDYRGLDFRKPVSRHFADEYAPTPHRYADFPVFNGKYSTLHATWTRSPTLPAPCSSVSGRSPRRSTRAWRASSCIAPYHWMPVERHDRDVRRGGFADSEDGRRELAALADQARVPYDAVLAEIRESPDSAGRRPEPAVSTPTVHTRTQARS